jgi:tetratricopeptide (TPR) repeat protein
VATLADGTTRPLIYIRNWNFHWQDAYRYAAPVQLPAGTTLTMEFMYDNSAANPVNRGKPLRRVTYGQRTSDEMGDLWIQVVPRRAADLPILVRSLRQKLVPQHIAGYRMMLAADPGNPSLHDDLALLLWEAGDVPGVAAEFSESLRLKPAAPAAHYNLGNALLPMRRFDEAERHFRDAIALDASYAPGHFGLGLALQATGHCAEASTSYRRALQLRPDWSEASAHLREVESSRCR